MTSALLFRSLTVANPRTGVVDDHIEPLEGTAVGAVAHGETRMGAVAAQLAPCRNGGVRYRAHRKCAAAGAGAVDGYPPPHHQQLRDRWHQGDGATGAAMIDNVDYSAFSGSVASERRVGETAARTFIPASLVLGGRDPMLGLARAGTVAEAEAMAPRLNAGDIEKSSFGLSGLGPPRQGPAGLLRFFRRPALLRQTGKPLPLSACADHG